MAKLVAINIATMKTDISFPSPGLAMADFIPPEQGIIRPGLACDDFISQLQSVMVIVVRYTPSDVETGTVTRHITCVVSKEPMPV